MSRLVVFFAIQSFIFVGNAQQYDAQWIFAPNPSVLDFRNDTITANTLQGSFNISLACADICDSAGNLLFSTNGINIYDKNANLLPNGDSLSPCFWTDYEFTNGLDIPQAALFIPTPGHPYYYHLFHFSADTADSTRPGTLYYSLLDNLNDSVKIDAKNVVFYKGEFRGGGMTACKHANGRDYWMVIGGLDDNSFYKFLLTPDTILGPFVQAIGPSYLGPYDVCYSKFSQDGSKYATGCYEGLITVLDFDRCSGEFSNPITIFNEASTDPLHDPLSGSVAVEFSPSGRFLYVGGMVNINQYDLEDTINQDSVQLYLADSSDYAFSDMLQLAPNGKIYSDPWNGGFYFLHVINNPDSLGVSCNFVYGGLMTLTEDDDALPNMINYNLGALFNSGCDTIPDSTVGIKTTALNNLLRVTPNPADKYLYVEMGMQGNYLFQLYNSAGQLISTKETRQVDIFDTENLASGVYFIRVLDKKPDNVATKKVVIQH